MICRAFAVLLLGTIASACFPTCRFSLCNPVPVKISGPSDRALTGPVCLAGKRVGVGKTGEARVQTFQGGYNLISRLRPTGLTQKFSPDFFKTYPIPNSAFTGIGHELAQGNQDLFLGGRCAYLPIREYQLFDFRKPEVVENYSLRGNPNVDCVSFVIGHPTAA